MIFLRTYKGRSATDVKLALEELWKVYRLIRKGKLPSSNITVPSGNLSVLVGFGPTIFQLNGMKKSVPENFVQFLPSERGGILVEGCGIKYSRDHPTNLGLKEAVAIQVISDSQLPVYRAIVETWKHIQATRRENVLRFSKFYTGFQRNDGRSWLGFHDEISNLKNFKERQEAIFINPSRNDLSLADHWTTGGTYMVFLRTEINLMAWEKIQIERQELIVGRDKESGMPIFGLDRNGRPVHLARFTKKYRKNDSKYVNHPDYFMLQDIPRGIKQNLDLVASTRTMSQSHIGRVRHIDGMSSGLPSSRRIYRHGFEFIEPSNYKNSNKPRVGLNFISFQNDPSRVLFILTDQNWMGNTNFGGNKSSLPNLLSILSSGIFYIPPLEMPFPGASVFR